MKSILIIFFLFLLICCTNKEKSIRTPDKIGKVHYFLFEEPWQYYKGQNTICYKYTYLADSAKVLQKRTIIKNLRLRDSSFAKESVFLDSVRFCGSTYELVHNNGIDTVFTKEVSFLDSIDYYDIHFFSDIEKVGKFFGKHFSSEPDSLDIYIIEKMSDSDSSIFRRVNRFVMPCL